MLFRSMMGLEEHLLSMFRNDHEFHDGAAPSHLVHAPRAPEPEPVQAVPSEKAPVITGWAADAEKELQKIPFFVRGKARRNTERYAAERGVPLITIETLYDAKAHFSR